MNLNYYGKKQLINARKSFFSKSSFTESLTSTLNGASSFKASVSNLNSIKEFNNDLTEEDKKGKKRFLIYRSNPADPEDNPHFMSYYLDLN